MKKLSSIIGKDKDKKEKKEKEKKEKKEKKDKKDKKDADVDKVGIVAPAASQYPTSVILFCGGDFDISNIYWYLYIPNTARCR